MLMHELWIVHERLLGELECDNRRLAVCDRRKHRLLFEVHNRWNEVQSVPRMVARGA